MKIRLGTPNDVKAYQYLMAEGFTGDWHAERFRWQYSGTAVRSILFIAENDQEPVGMLGLDYRRLNNGWSCATVIDMVVAAGWRRKGVLGALENTAFEHALAAGAAVMTSLLNKPGAAALGRLPGWSIVSEVSLLRRPSSRPFPATLVSPGVGREAGEAIEIARDAACRDWRYLQHPRYRYTILESDKRKAAAVKLFGTVGDIVEVYGSNSNLDAFEEIYRLAAEKLASAGAREVVTWGLVPAGEYELLLCLGWERAPQERHLAVKALNPAAEFLYRRESWRIQPADIEHY